MPKQMNEQVYQNIGVQAAVALAVKEREQKRTAKQERTLEEKARRAVRIRAGESLYLQFKNRTDRGY